MKFSDKTTTGNDSDVKKNLDRILRLIVDEAQKVFPNDGNDVVSEIIRRTALCSALNLRMMIDLYDYPVECIAWISRNLFEMNLLIEYSIRFPEKAKEFCLQKGSDEIEILEGISKLSSTINTNSVRERIDHLQEAIRKHGSDTIKHFTVADMAGKVGMKEEYDAFFKFYSKYVHPSAWLIFASEEEKANSNYRNIFLYQAQYYSARILKICEDWAR